jgi:hypothetical protein
MVEGRIMDEWEIMSREEAIVEWEEVRNEVVH